MAAEPTATDPAVRSLQLRVKHLERVSRLTTNRVIQIGDAIVAIQGQIIEPADKSRRLYSLAQAWCRNTRNWVQTGFMAPNFRSYYNLLAIDCSIWVPGY